jgi:predicted metal-dependent hydrolase
MFQLRLQFLHSKDALADCLEDMTGKPVSLTVTDNAASLLSIRTKGASVSVRMHWMFLNAGEEVIREIAGFIKTRKGRTPLIRKFIGENRAFLKKKERPASRPNLQTVGRFHDLKEVFDDINREYFQGNITAFIGWGKQRARRLVRKRTLGSYCRHGNTIRISPVLDGKNVPRYFLEFVVYHEMLHSDMKEEKKNGRRSVHPPEFQKRERLFREYEKAAAWEKKRW